MASDQNLNARDFAFNQTEPVARPYDRAAGREEGGLFFRASVAGIIVASVAFVRNWLQPAAANAGPGDEEELQLAAHQPVPPQDGSGDTPEILLETDESEDEEDDALGSSTSTSILAQHPLFSASVPIPLLVPLRRSGQNDNGIEFHNFNFAFTDTLSFRPSALNVAPAPGNGGGGGGGGGSGGSGSGGGGSGDGEEDPDTRTNAAPVVTGQVLLGTLTLSSALLIGLPELLRNAHDSDGDPLHVQNLVASSGRLAQMPGGGWLFVAALDEPAVVTFTYKVSDGTAAVTQHALLNLVAAPGGTQTVTGSGYIVGTAAGETLIGTPDKDVIDALDGDDLVIGRESRDIIFGGAGNDRIVAGDGDDIVFAGAGDDVVFGGKGDDIVLGEDGDDVLLGEEGADELFGGSGNDVLAGGADKDRIAGGEGADRIVAEAGDGDDVIDGGDGRDTLDLASTTADAVIDLAAGRASSLDIGNDTLTSIENVIAGAGDDRILASDARNELAGGGGDDVFVFRTVASIGRGANRDKIMDFETGDRIDLDDIANGLEDQVEAAFQSATIRRFVLLGPDEAFSRPGQMKFAFDEDSGGPSPYTLIMGNVDDDADADFEIEIAGHYNFTIDDFRGHS